MDKMLAKSVLGLSRTALKHSFPTASTIARKSSAAMLHAKTNRGIYYDEFSQAYPDFMMSPVLNRRNSLFEELVQADMIERRIVLDIPEFYVGSILAVTTSDPNLGNRRNRFVGICISRTREGLHHRFTLRNVIDGLGVEVMYEMYNPTILKIETLKLEKRLDDDLTYLQDALPKYSTFDFNLEPVAHPSGTPVPVNPLKVEMRPPPWSSRWELYDLKGIDESMWKLVSPYRKRQMIRNTKIWDSQKFDIIMHSRNECRDYERDLTIQDRICQFEQERHKTTTSKRRILRMASSSISVK